MTVTRAPFAALPAPPPLPVCAASQQRTSHVDLRRAPYQLRIQSQCCGENALKISMADIGDDKYRVDLYCDNLMCDVLEMAVLPLRTDRPVAWRRTDVAALHVIDEGSEEEQAEAGFTIHRDDEGRYESQRDQRWRTQRLRPRRRSAHRREPSRTIRIEPPPPEEDDDRSA